MQREEAVEILKQVLEGSSYAYYKSLTLLLNPKNGLSKGYQIRLEPRNEDLEPHISKIARDTGLAVAREGTCWIIYRPHPSKGHAP